MCGSCSNENAFKLAFMRAARKRRGGALPTAEDYESCMQHEEPGGLQRFAGVLQAHSDPPWPLGSPRYSILGFEGAFHGRLLGCLSVTHSKALHKVSWAQGVARSRRAHAASRAGRHPRVRLAERALPTAQVPT